MKKSSIILILSAIAMFVAFTIHSNVYAEGMDEIFQTVAYLTGEGEVEHTSIDGIEYELWIKSEAEKQPHPFRKPSSGTGFFVQNNNQIYLITVQHVANKLKHNVKIILHGPDGKPIIYKLNDLTDGQGNYAWFYHLEADIALLKLTPPNNFKGLIGVLEPNLLLANEADFSKYSNRVLTTVGFPLSLGLKGKFSPITKESKVSSSLLRHKRFDKNIESTFFILDDPSVQGFSGAPVYALGQVSMGGVAFGVGKFACLGLMHGTLGDNTGGKFAAVVPSYFIKELIDECESQKVANPQIN